MRLSYPHTPVDSYLYSCTEETLIQWEESYSCLTYEHIRFPVNNTAASCPLGNCHDTMTSDLTDLPTDIKTFIYQSDPCCDSLLLTAESSAAALVCVVSTQCWLLFGKNLCLASAESCNETTRLMFKVISEELAFFRFLGFAEEFSIAC